MIIKPETKEMNYVVFFRVVERANETTNLQFENYIETKINYLSVQHRPIVSHAHRILAYIVNFKRNQIGSIRINVLFCSVLSPSDGLSVGPMLARQRCAIQEGVQKNNIFNRKILIEARDRCLLYTCERSVLAALKPSNTEISECRSLM